MPLPCFYSLFSFLSQMSNFVSYMIPHDAGKNRVHLYTHMRMQILTTLYFFSFLFSSLLSVLVRGQILWVFFALRNLSHSLVIFKNLCLRKMCICVCVYAACKRCCFLCVRLSVSLCECTRVRLCVCMCVVVDVLFFYPFVLFTLFLMMQTHSHHIHTQTNI